MRKGGRLERLKEHVEVEGSDEDRIFVLNPTEFKAKFVEQYANLNSLNPSHTKSKDGRKTHITTSFTFQRYYDVLEILFSFLDISDVATMAKVEPFLAEFVEGNYHLRIVLPISEEQRMMLERTTKKFVLRLESNCSPMLRLESNCSPMLYKDQLAVFKLKHLKEIKLLLPCYHKHEDVVYNEIMEQIFDEARMMRKVELSVNSRVHVIKKCPSGVQELTLRFVEDRWNNVEEDDRHTVSVLQTALQSLNKLKKLKINHMIALGIQEVKLHSDSITSFIIENTKRIRIKELRFPSLTHLTWEDRFWNYYIYNYNYGQNEHEDCLKILYEGCPQLESLNDVTLNFSREIGVEEWIERCKSSLRASSEARRR